MQNSELESIIQQAIKDFEYKTEWEESGRVVSVYDGIAKVYGLNNVTYQEVVRFENDLKGIVMGLYTEYVVVMLLSKQHEVSAGMLVYRTCQQMSINVSDKLLGRVVNGYGEPIDSKGPVGVDKVMSVEVQAPEMLDRSPVERQVVTGIREIDWLIPVGYGQRETILGSRGSGKTSLVTDIILSQKDKKNVVSIYVSIGQKADNASSIQALLDKNGVKNYIIVCAYASDPASARYLAPLVGTSIGEYFMHKGMDAILYYDTLTNHAIAYREISLIMRRPPGREAFPGDMFYQHAKLLERAAQLNTSKGGGSLTSFPLVDIVNDDISAFIPTNIMSITDGQIILSSNLATRNVRPAIDIGTSVTRVGGAVQTSILKKLVSSLKLDIARSDEYQGLSAFSTDINDETKQIIERGQFFKKVLQQKRNNPMSMWQQIIVLYALIHSYFIDIDNIHILYEKTNKYSNYESDILAGNEEILKQIMGDL